MPTQTQTKTQDPTPAFLALMGSRRARAARSERIPAARWAAWWQYAELDRPADLAAYFADYEARYRERQPIREALRPVLAALLAPDVCGHQRVPERAAPLTEAEVREALRTGVDFLGVAGLSPREWEAVCLALEDCENEDPAGRRPAVGCLRRHGARLREKQREKQREAAREAAKAATQRTGAGRSLALFLAAEEARADSDTRYAEAA